KPIITNHLWVIYIIALLAIALLFYFNWLIGLIGAILLTLSFYYMYLSEKRYQYDQLEYISNLSYRVEGVGNDTLFQMPIGMILYNDSYEIEWINLYMKDFTEEENMIGKSLDIISKNIITKIKRKKKTEKMKAKETDEEFKNNKDEQKLILKIDEFEYVFYFDQQRQLLYFFDKTNELSLKRENYEEQTVIAFIYLDNYEEIS